MNRLPLLLIILVLFSSCSLGKIGYSFGDWLIKREILGYVKLYQKQQEKLETELDHFMEWHKKEMMPKYVSDLSSLEKNINTLSFDRDVKSANDLVEDTFILVKKRYVESFIPLALKVSPILSTLNDQQIQRTREIVAKKFDQKSNEEKTYTKEQRMAFLKKNFEQWLGPLTKEQETWLVRKSDQVLDPSRRQKRLTKKGYRRKSYLDIFDYKDEAKRTAIQFEYWDAFAVDFLKVDDDKKLIMHISELLLMTTKEQRKHLIGKLAYYRRMIEGIL